MIHGENLILAINGTPLAASKSCSLSKSQSFINISSPTSGRWEACVPKQLSWSMSADCLLGTMDAYNTLNAAWKNGTELTIRFYDTDRNENETGTAYIQNLNLEASNGSLAKMSISLQGSGELSEYEGVQISLSDQWPGEIDDIYYSISGDTALNHEAEGGRVACYTFLLTKRTKVKIKINKGNFMISESTTFLQDIDGSYDFSLQERNVTAGVQTQEMWLDAKRYYIVFCTTSTSNWQHKLYDLT